MEAPWIFVWRAYRFNSPRMLKQLLTCVITPLFLVGGIPRKYTPIENVYHRVSTEEKVIALTFDDGPHPLYTEKILNLLEKYDAKATFFVIGENLELYKDTVKRAVAAGHEIGNHTYTHPHLSALSEEELFREIEQNERLIEAMTEKPTSLFRPPEGYCGRAVRSLIKERGYRAILWDVDTRDWAGVPAQEIIKTVQETVYPGSILLFHDYGGKQSATLTALSSLLPWLQAKGYRFVTVSELLDYSSEGSASSSS